MGPRRRQLGTAFAFVFTAAALAACGGGGSAETVDAALVCDDIAVLDESIQALEDLEVIQDDVEVFSEPGLLLVRQPEAGKKGNVLHLIQT